MSQTAMKCVKADYSNYIRGRFKTCRNRKTTAINGRRSIQALKPIPLDYSTPSSSRRRKRRVSKESEEGAREDGEEGGSRDGEDGEEGEEARVSQDNGDGVRTRGSTSTLISFEKVIPRGSTHTHECCRLSVPRAFCERYNVESDLVFTDSAGSRLWPMRIQSCGVWKASRNPVYTISNGWREFAYDHSLKVNDRVVFTLLSTSHFLVEFATSNGSTCAMIPTRDGDNYPWRLNYSRLDCLSNANRVDPSRDCLLETQEKVIRRNMAPIASEEDESQQRTLAPITLQEDDQGVIRIKTVARITLKDEDELEVIRKDAATITLKGDKQEEPIRPLSGSRRGSPTTTPHKQQLEKKMFCQCDTANVRNTRRNTRRKEYVLPEFTHLECKNADGSTYLHIIDSDGE